MFRWYDFDIRISGKEEGTATEIPNLRQQISFKGQEKGRGKKGRKDKKEKERGKHIQKEEKQSKLEKGRRWHPFVCFLLLFWFLSFGGPAFSPHFQ